MNRVIPLVKLQTKTNNFYIGVIEMKIKNHSREVLSATSQKVDTKQGIGQIFKKSVFFGMSLFVSSEVMAFDIGVIPYTRPIGWNIAENSNYGTNAGKPYKNVHIYRKTNENTYVQIVDMMDGGHVRLLQEFHSHRNDGLSLWRREYMDYWWNKIGRPESSNSSIPQTSRVSVVNAGFFDNDTYPDKGTMSFGIKVNGQVIDRGGDNNDQGGKPLMQLSFHRDAPSVTIWYDGSLETISAPNAIVGRHRHSKGKRPWLPMGRTFMCTIPHYSVKHNKTYNLLLVYVAESKTQGDANIDLDAWGCKDNTTVMFDGHNSSQLVTKGGINVRPYGRRVAQAVGIFN